MADIPGIRGYLLGQEGIRRQNADQFAHVQGVLQMQNMLKQQAWDEQLQPLRIAQLQTAVDQAKQNAALRQGILSNVTGGGMATPQGALTAGAARGDVGPTVTNAARIGTPQGVLSPFPGVNPNAALMMLSGDAGLGKLGSAIQDANKPIAAREGAPVINPQTGEILFYAPKLETGMMPSFSGGQITGVSNIPGYVPAMTERTTATEGAKAGLDLVEIPGVGRMSRLDAINRFSPSRAAPTPMPPAATPPGWQIPPDIQAQRDAEANRIRTAEAQPGGGGLLPSKDVLKGYVQTDAEKAGAVASSRERAESGVKFEDAVLTAGRNARNNLTSLQMLAPNVEKLPTGPLYPMLVTAKNYLQQFGLSVDPNLGPAQATESLLNQFALKLRDPSAGGGMPGAMSDPDRKFLVASIPSLDKSPSGNKLLMKIFMALEQRKIDEAAIVNRMQADNRTSNEIRDALSQFANERSLIRSIK